jgi:hypothetical protein
MKMPPNHQPALDAAKAFSSYSLPHGRGPSEAGRSASRFPMFSPHTALVCFCVLLSIASPAQERITAARFREIVSTPGDTMPLNAKLAAAGPLWTNATVRISLAFADGRTFREEVAETTKTIAGKYVVTRVASKFYKQPMDSIMAYDDQASDYKVWALFGEAVTEGRIVYDPKKRIFAMDSAYGDGFTELGVGSYSDTESSSRTSVFKNGLLFCTRDATTTPSNKAK